MVVPYELIYFNVRGRGEPVRLMLHDNGLNFKEIILDWDTWIKQWKSQTQFGQAPVLRDNDFQVVQSNAILRHLARRHGLYGNTVEEATQIDIINDGVEDLRVKYLTMIYKNYENGKDDHIASLASEFLPFEKLLAKNGADKTGFCVGDKRSFADYNLADILDVHRVLAPNCLDNFPTLSAYYKLIYSRPAIAAYRETNTFKERNINGNGKQ